MRVAAKPSAQGTKPIPAEQLASFFTFDMFGLFLEVFIVWQLKLKIDIWRDSGQLLGSSTAHWPSLIRRPLVEKLLVKCSLHVPLFVMEY